MAKNKLKKVWSEDELWQLSYRELLHLLLSTDRFATKESTIETIESFPGSVKVSEGDVDLACRFLFHMDAVDRSILGLAFVFDVLGEVFVPVWFAFPAILERKGKKRRRKKKVSVRSIGNVIGGRCALTRQG